MKEEYTIWFYNTKGHVLSIRHMTSEEILGFIDGVRIDDFLPLTRESEGFLSMMYPDLPIDDLKDAIKAWENFIVRGDKTAYRTVYFWQSSYGYWY